MTVHVMGGQPNQGKFPIEPYSPGETVSTLVEQQYQSQMDALSPRQRVERSMAMFQWTRELLARQILSTMGPMSDERLKWEVALRQYGADPVARATIQRKLADVPR